MSYQDHPSELKRYGWWTPLLNGCKVEVGIVLLLMPLTQTFGFRNTLQSVITEGGPSGEIVLSSMGRTHRELVLEGLVFQKEHIVLHLTSETKRMCVMNCLATKDVQTVPQQASPRTVDETGQTSAALKHFQLEDCNQDLSNVHCDVLSLSPTDYSYLPPSTLPIAFTNKMISPSGVKASETDIITPYNGQNLFIGQFLHFRNSLPCSYFDIELGDLEIASVDTFQVVVKNLHNLFHRQGQSH